MLKKIHDDYRYAEGIVSALLYGELALQNPIHKAAIEKVVNHYRISCEKNEQSVKGLEANI